MLDLLGLKPQQSLLLASEPRTLPLSATFRKVAAAERLETLFVELPARTEKRSGLADVFHKILGSVEAALIIRSQPDPISLSYLRTQTHTRVALLAGADEDSLQRCLEANHRHLNDHCRKLADILTIGRSLRLTAENGTDIKLSLAQMRGTWESAPLNGTCYCGSLPLGRAYIAPVANSAQGIVVLQMLAGQRAGSGSAIQLKVRDGRIVQVKGERSAQALRQLLRRGETRSRSVVEIGFGLNDRARLGQSALEDEKVRGTAHLGFGESGGAAKPPMVLARGIISAPCVSIDGQKIMERGQLSFA